MYCIYVLHFNSWQRVERVGKAPIYLQKGPVIYEFIYSFIYFIIMWYPCAPMYKPFLRVSVMYSILGPNGLWSERAKHPWGVPYIFTKEPFVSAKEPYISTKSPVSICPTSSQKSPLCLQKSPISPQRALYLFISFSLGNTRGFWGVWAQDLLNFLVVEEYSFSIERLDFPRIIILTCDLNICKALLFLRRTFPASNSKCYKSLSSFRIFECIPRVQKCGL